MLLPTRATKRVPEVARACLAALGTQLLRLQEQILAFDRMIMAWHRSNQTSKRLHYIPGVGPMLATALVASVADPRTFRSGRNFSAWIGLVPKQHSSGGKDGLGSISKQGDRYLRSLFVAGALAVIRYAKIHGTKHRPWLTALLGRRPPSLSAPAAIQMNWTRIPHIPNMITVATIPPTTAPPIMNRSANALRMPCAVMTPRAPAARCARTKNTPSQ
jgi:transposase